jgi:hypothetical protein
MSRLFVPQGQGRGVVAMLAAAGLHWPAPRGVSAVSRPGELAGFEGATFAYIENHCEPVDQLLLEAVQVYGLVLMKLNDQAARDRHERDNPKLYPKRRVDLPRPMAATQELRTAVQGHVFVGPIEINVSSELPIDLPAMILPDPAVLARRRHAFLNGDGAA